MPKSVAKNSGKTGKPEGKKKAVLTASHRSLLKVKIKKARRTPRFKRQELWAQAMLKDTWRKPKGRHSKMREQQRGRGRLPQPGYGSPAAVKGLNKQGFMNVRVFNVSDVSKLNKEKESAVIASTVGGKKRAEMLKKAEELGVTVTNP